MYAQPPQEPGEDSYGAEGCSQWCRTFSKRKDLTECKRQCKLWGWPDDWAPGPESEPPEDEPPADECRPAAAADASSEFGERSRGPGFWHRAWMAFLTLLGFGRLGNLVPGALKPAGQRMARAEARSRMRRSLGQESLPISALKWPWIAELFMQFLLPLGG